MVFQVKKRFLVYSTAIASLFCLSYNIEARGLPIVPDETMGETIRVKGNQIDINGGQIKGTTQFNSLEKLDIPSGMEVIINNPESVQNIILRVTGGEVSNLDGILTTQGTSNLWLMNPSGFIFGEGFKTNIGRDLNVTTAQELLFADDTRFNLNSNIANLSRSKLLGANFSGDRKIPRVIIFRGEGHNFKPLGFLRGKLSSELKETNKNTIEISDNRNLTLIGEKIDFNGARLRSKSGAIKAIAVQEGEIIFNNDNSFNLDRVKNFGNISISNASLIQATSSTKNETPPGAVELTGRRVNIEDISILISQNTNNSPAQNIKITATEAFNVRGRIDPNNPFARAGIYSETDTEAIGKGSSIEIYSPKIEWSRGFVYSSSISKGNAGDITFTGKSLRMADVSAVNSIIRSTGDSGEIKLDILNNIEISEPFVEDTTSDITTNIGVINFGFGKSKKILINSNKIEVLNGAKIFNRTLALGLIRPSDLTEFTGSGENLEITSETLLVSGVRAYDAPPNNNDIENSSFVGTYNLNKIEIGDLLLNVDRLIVEKQGVVGSYTFSEGNTGKAIINASDSIDLNRGKIVVSVEIASDRYQAAYGIFTQSGEAGQLSVTTRSISATNASEIRVSNFGNNAAGIANINSDRSILENSKISATTSAGSGKLNINSKDFRASNSQITTAGKGIGTGGDINIVTDTFVANNGTEVLATAVEGNGGDINIQGNLGIFRSDDSVFSAESESGIDGTVNFDGMTENRLGEAISKRVEPKTLDNSTTFDRYSDPRSPLSANYLLQDRREEDPRLKENLAYLSIVQRAPQDPALLESYLRQHFEGVEMIGNSGGFSLKDIKNSEDVPLSDTSKLASLSSLEYHDCN